MMCLPFISTSDRTRLTSHTACVVFGSSLLLTAAHPASAQDADLPTESEPDVQPDEQKSSLFFDSETGDFDVSDFLSTRIGFLPIAMPITEPAVGYGLSIGLSFFHDTPQAVPRGEGESPQVIMPSTTVLLGAGTENGTWATGVAHLGMWDEGRIRYLGAIGYTSLDLDWYGKGGSFGDQSIPYENDVFLFIQRINFQIPDSQFFIGPNYRFFSTDASFDTSSLQLDVPSTEFESATAGLGVNASYDSLDHPYSPTRGIHAEIGYSQQDDAFGGDFDYGKLTGYGITYLPLTDQTVLGLHANGAFNLNDAPFYDLPGLVMRGLTRGRYVDDAAVLLEAELRYDLTERWTAVGFGGVGRVAGSLDDIFDADDHWAGGAGFRYLVAEDYGLRLGLDVAYGDDDVTIYITVGTGWIRP